MSGGTGRRIVSIWFPRLASDRALRRCQTDGPFALTISVSNTRRIYCLNRAAERQGLHRGMPMAEASAFCPDLQTRLADPPGDARLLEGLRRWAGRYSPWVGLEGGEGLVLDITGAAHLFGGEAPLLGELRHRLQRAGFSLHLGLADTRGAARALARHGGGIAPPGETQAALAPLPVAGLGIDPETVTRLQRLGLRTIGQVQQTARAPLARRFGPDLLRRLDQALGQLPDTITPLPDPPHDAVRLTLPDPIGMTEDVMAGVSRLLVALCRKLVARQAGARRLLLSLRRVDQESRQIDLRLAAAMQDPARILPLFARKVAEIDAGFGIDQLRLEATEVEAMPPRQLRQNGTAAPERLENLMTRIGARIGLDNIQRFQPVDSHIPERSFRSVPATSCSPSAGWHSPRPRPLRLFPPEPILARGSTPPAQFRWRRLRLTTARASGPERITPSWWEEDDNWRSGLRDYWRIETHQGRRLWLFFTPQNPGWFVQGEFA